MLNTTNPDVLFNHLKFLSRQMGVITDKIERKDPELYENFDRYNAKILEIVSEVEGTIGQLNSPEVTCQMDIEDMARYLDHNDETISMCHRQRDRCLEVGDVINKMRTSAEKIVDTLSSETA